LSSNIRTKNETQWKTFQWVYLTKTENQHSSNKQTHSIWGVWGNISTGITLFSS